MVALVTVNAPSVTFAPVPLWLVSGATTVTLVCGSAVNACTVALIPGADTPSSFVTRTVNVDEGLEAAPALWADESARRRQSGERAQQAGCNEACVVSMLHVGSLFRAASHVDLKSAGGECNTAVLQTVGDSTAAQNDVNRAK